MRLTVSSYTFEAIPLDGALAVCKSIGFKGVDIAGFHGRGRASYEPDEVGANPQKFADDAKRLLDKHGLEAVEYFPQFGLSFFERSINDPDPSVRERNFTAMKGIAQFCKLMGIHSITVLPGADHPSQTKQQNMDISGQSLKRYTEITGEQSVVLCFEPHMGSVANTPELALELVQRAPDAKVTLDYSHYTLQYIDPERVHKMIPYTGHVHIRAARPGKLQTAWRENAIDFVDIIKRLKAVNYDHCLSVEYVCSDWYDCNELDTIFETLTTKEALEKYVAV